MATDENNTDQVDQVQMQVNALRDQFEEIREQLDSLRNQVDINSPLDMQDAIDDMADALRREMEQPLSLFGTNDIVASYIGDNAYSIGRNDQAYWKCSNYYDSGYKMKIRMGPWQHNGTVLVGSFIGAGTSDGVWGMPNTLYAAPVGALDGGASTFKVGTLAELTSDGTAHLGYAVKLATGTVETVDGGSAPKIVQEVKHSIITASAYPDSDTYFTAVNPRTYTIEWKPSSPVDDAHNGELQLYGTDNQQNTMANTEYAIPYLQRDDANTGVLRWAPPDADSGGLQAGSGKSIELVSGVFQFGGWAAHVEEAPASDDQFVMYDQNGGDPLYCNSSNLMDTFGKTWWNYMVGKVHDATADWVTYKHVFLDFSDTTAGQGDQNYDHARAHAVIGDDWQGGTFAGVAGVWYQSIGRGDDSGTGEQTADALAIDLMNMRLHDVTDYYTVDWNLCRLYDKPGGAQGPIVVDWDLQTMYKADGATAAAGTLTVDWNSAILYDGTTQCLTWDGTSVDVGVGVVADPAFRVLDDADVNPGSLGSAAARISGGLDVTKSVQADKFLLHDSTGNYWDGTDFKTDVTGNVEIDGATEVRIHSAGAALLYSTAGNTYVGADAGNVNIDPSGELQINGTPGKTTVFQVTQGGVTKDATFVKGVLTDVS